MIQPNKNTACGLLLLLAIAAGFSGCGYRSADTEASYPYEKSNLQEMFSETTGLSANETANSAEYDPTEKVNYTQAAAGEAEAKSGH